MLVAGENNEIMRTENSSHPYLTSHNFLTQGVVQQPQQLRSLRATLAAVDRVRRSRGKTPDYIIPPDGVRVVRVEEEEREMA